MIRLLHGKNEFAIAEEVDAIKRELDMHGGAGADLTEAQGKGLSPADLLNWCSAMPFMAPKRLVVVTGLFATDYNISEWSRHASGFVTIPPTTELIFAEQDAVPKNHALAVIFKGFLKEQRFDIPRSARLVEWIVARFRHYDAQATPDAAHQLAGLAGGKLRLLDREVEKLSTYAVGRPVGRGDVELLVSSARDANVFAVLDAIVERQTTKALQQIFKLLRSGESFSTILVRLASQLRRVLQAADMLSDRKSPAEIGEELNIRYDFILQRTLRQARLFSIGQLVAKMRTLHELDVEVKTGRLSEASALQLMVVRLAN